MSDPTRICRNCNNYRESVFCGYISPRCGIHGSLDVDQHERHPDTEAARCKDFTPKRSEPEDDKLQRMIRALWPNGCR